MSNDVKQMLTGGIKVKYMSEEERIFSGELYASEDPELIQKKLKTHRLSREYNNLFEEDYEARKTILQELLGDIGERTFMPGPIHFHYGCHFFFLVSRFIVSSIALLMKAVVLSSIS